MNYNKVKEIIKEVLEQVSSNAISVSEAQSKLEVAVEEYGDDTFERGVIAGQESAG